MFAAWHVLSTSNQETNGRAIAAAHGCWLADLLAAAAGPVRGVPMMTGNPLPLDGIRVLDLSGPVGAYGGRLLADIGADVVKVELPDGDELRRQGPFAGRRSVCPSTAA